LLRIDRRWLLALLAVPLLATGRVEAGSAEWALGPEGADFVLDVFTVADGLPQNSVNDVVRTRDGYLWVATYGGIARFDGVRFTRFEIVDHPGLAGNRALSLHEAQDGSVWIGLQRDGVVRFHDGSFMSFGADQGAPVGVVLRIDESDDGTLWFAGGSGLVRRRTDGAFEAVDSGEPPGTFGVWAGGGRTRVSSAAFGLARVVGDRLIEDPPWNVNTRRLHAMLRDPRELVWVGDDAGARLLDPRGAVVAELEQKVWDIAAGPRGGVWIAGSRLRRVELDDEGRPARVVEPLGPSLPFDIRSMAVDHEGSVWLGTQGGGLLRLRPRQLRLYTSPGTVRSREVLAVTPDRQGGLWLTTGCGPPLHFANGRFEPLDLDTEGCAGGLLVDRDGTLWFGWPSGLVRYAGGQARRIEIGHAVEAILQDREGRIWVPTPQGLGRVTEGRIESAPAPPGEWSMDTVVLLEDSRGAIWAGGARGLVRFADGVYRRWTTADGVPRGELRALHEDAAGALWIGTYGGGLARMKDGAIATVTAADGLVENFVSVILEDDEGRLWLNGNRGLSSVLRSDLEDFLEGRVDTVTPRLLGPDDGGAEGSGATHPAGCRTADGRLWFPTVDGLLTVDPRDVQVRSAPPPPVIEGLTVNGTARDPDESVRVRAHLKNLEIRYTALSLLRPRQIAFRYRLKGYDDDWVHAGTRRTAFYTDLPPGRYTFLVMATNGDGVWSAPTASAATITVIPALRNTWWFRGLIAAVAVVLGVALVRFRIAAIRGRNRALREEMRRHSETEARLRTVISHSPVVLFALDGNGVFTLSDGLALETIGLKPGEAVGHSALEMYHDNPAIVENLRACLAGEEREWSATEAGRVFEVRGAPLRDDDGRVTGMIGVATDVTERVDAESERQQLQEQLYESQKLDAVGRLAGGVAHDFNNLLTIIRGHVELLRQAVDDGEDTQRSLSEIERAQESAASLTSQLLAFARRQVVQPMPLDVNQVLRRLEGMLRRVIGEHLELDFALADHLDLIEADAGQIEQIVVNLLVNARDAMPRGGRIEVRTENLGLSEATVRGELSPGRYVVLTVQDEGEGIPPEVRSRIFEPFFSTKMRGRGTGLGLATVFGIVKQSGGEIEVASDAGEGTTFRLLFPATGAERAEPLPEERLEQGAGGGRETILLAEDDDALRGLLDEVLRGLGYTVLSAGDGPSARRLASQHDGPIDLLLTDVVMPGQGGKELAEEIRRALPDIRVVYMSGHTDDSLPGGVSVRKGRDRFLAKPFSPKTLARVLRNIFDSDRERGAR